MKGLLFPLLYFNIICQMLINKYTFIVQGVRDLVQGVY